MNAAVPVSIGIICLIGAGLIAWFGNLQWPRLTVALLLTGVQGILNGTLGPMIRHGVNLADHRFSDFIGQWTGTAVTGIIGAIVLGIAGFRIYQNSYDNKTLIAVAMVPATIALIPGTVGDIARSLVGFVPTVVSTVIGWAFGIGG